MKEMPKAYPDFFGHSGPHAGDGVHPEYPTLIKVVEQPLGEKVSRAVRRGTHQDVGGLEAGHHLRNTPF